MKWQLWKVYGDTYFLTNGDGWIYLRESSGKWFQTWCPENHPTVLNSKVLIANNYKESKKKRKYYHATL